MMGEDEGEEEEDEGEEGTEEEASRWHLAALLGPNRVVVKMLLWEASWGLLRGRSGAPGRHF